MPAAIDVYLIAGGKFHDIDFARRELLSLLAEHERVRVRIGEDYRDVEAIAKADMLVTYVCDIVPDAAQIDAIRRFLARGRRWLALHGTNSTLEFAAGGKVRCPPLPEAFVEIVGSQFMAHPPISRYKVKPAAAQDPLIAGIGEFHVEDEHYLQDYRPGNEPLLITRFGGRTSLFEREEWPEQEHLVMYRRKSSGGEVLYLTLGHARGRYDMRPIADFYPLVERGAWQLPVFHELLRRCIGWGLDAADGGG
jgi:type 1 glutamine amidotransferase